MTDRISTYRLQLHAGFSFDAAAAQVEYLRDLGVSHVYCSPVLQAAPGSTHGYDTVDPTRISADLGGEAGWGRLRDAAHAQGLSLLLDIVPNHMATHASNPWWWELLAQGQHSPHAAHFDVDWDSVLDPSMRGRVMVPVLGDHLGRVLERGELRVERRDGDGAAVLRYHQHELPLQGDRADLRTLDAQPYRLARWRLALRTLNYRRFFDITSLIALRAERPETYPVGT